MTASLFVPTTARFVQASQASEHQTHERHEQYAATPPRGNVPWNDGNVPRAPVQTGPFNAPKDYHPGPVGPPAVLHWQETSSSEWWRNATEDRHSPTPQGSYVEQGIGQTRGRLIADDPKWTPEPVIRTMYPPAASQLYGRPFDQRMTHRMSGQHSSMAGRRRAYQIIPGQRPVNRNTATYRIVPPSLDERFAAERGQPQLQLVPTRDRSQGGTWRLP